MPTPTRQSLQSRTPPAGSGRVCIVIPTYNERANVRPIVQAVLDAVPDASVLIVDDASPDGTGRLADELAAERPAVGVLHRRAKEGLGKAYVDGFRRAMSDGASIVVQMDADFSHPVRFLPELIRPLREGRADMAIGSRYVKGGQIPRWRLLRRFVSRGGSLFARIVLFVPYHDLTAGFKAWSAPVLDAVELERVHAGGYAFEVEMTYRAHRSGARIVEVPITFEERREGQSKMSFGIFMEAFWIVLGLRWAALRGALPKRTLQ